MRYAEGSVEDLQDQRRSSTINAIGAGAVTLVFGAIDIFLAKQGYGPISSPVLQLTVPMDVVPLLAGAVTVGETMTARRLDQQIVATQAHEDPIQ